MKLCELPTPAALIDTDRMQRNIRRMQQRMNALGVAFRPHVKTSKCIPVAKAQIDAGARGITVSTLKEAEQFFAAGVTDILYAVGMSAPKLKQAAALRARGCALKIIADSDDSARAIAEYCQQHKVKFEVWIESTSKCAIPDYSWSSPLYPIFLWRTYRRMSLPRQLLLSRTDSQVSLAQRAAPVINSHGGATSRLFNWHRCLDGGIWLDDGSADIETIRQR